MKTYKYAVLVLLVAVFGCREEKEQEILKPKIIPVGEGAALGFRGYVTDSENELAGKIYTFNRVFSHVDTIKGQEVYAFLSDKDRSYFRVDDAGTLEQLKTIDLSKRLWIYDLSGKQPVKFGYWETMFKQTEGEGTEWETLVDTTVTMFDAEKQPVEVRYYYYVKARYDGWSTTAIPESQKVEEVLDVNLLQIENFIVNETNSDSLFVKRGTGHYYFDPEVGMIKYVTDYHLKNRGEPYVQRHGTWELVQKKLPE